MMQMMGDNSSVVEVPQPLDLVYDSISPVFTHPVVGLAWSIDGTILTTYSGSHKSYAATVPFSLTDGLTFLGTITLTATSQGGGQGCCWSDDGTKFFTCSKLANRYAMWDVPTPFRVDSITTPTVSTYSSYLYQAKQITVFNGGSKMMTLSDADGSYIHIYDLSTPYDLSTAVVQYNYNGLENLQYKATSDHPIGTGKWQNGYVMASDGLSAISLVSTTTGPIWFHPLTTPFSPGSSETKVADDYSLNLTFNGPEHMIIPTGQKMVFVARDQHRTIEKYTWT